MRAHVAMMAGAGGGETGAVAVRGRQALGGDGLDGFRALGGGGTAGGLGLGREEAGAPALVHVFQDVEDGEELAADEEHEQQRAGAFRQHRDGGGRGGVRTHCWGGEIAHGLLYN